MTSLTGSKKKKSSRGGARPGSGPKRKLEGGSFTPAYLDDSTRETLTDLGDGNLSAGIRLAAKIVEAVNWDVEPVRSLIANRKKVFEEREEASA